MIQLNTIEEAIEDIRQGKVIIVVDDEDRENEGDFLAAAEKVTPEMINFMAMHGRGLICAPLTENRCRELGLELLSQSFLGGLVLELAQRLAQLFGALKLDVPSACVLGPFAGLARCRHRPWLSWWRG